MLFTVPPNTCTVGFMVYGQLLTIYRIHYSSPGIMRSSHSLHARRLAYGTVVPLVLLSLFLVFSEMAFIVDKTSAFRYLSDIPSFFNISPHGCLNNSMNNSMGVSKPLATYLFLVADARAAFGAPRSTRAKDTQLRTQSDKRDNVTLTIAQYSHVYGPSPLWSDGAGVWSSCQQPCRAVGGYGDAAAAASAEVVIFNLQDFSGAPWNRPTNQVWVGVYFESPVHYPNVEKKAVVSQFNLTMGFRPDSDLPILSMIYDTFQDFDRIQHFPLPTWKAKNAPGIALMSVWISNCAIDTTHRLSILRELASHGISYASYGRCQTTHDLKEALSSLPTSEWQDYGKEGLGAELMAVATKHMFFYAAENSEYPYYVTEKVFHGLVAGSVPVYIGDSVHLKQIAPPHSIIYADDFESVEVLATHLMKVARDPAMYESYLQWRGQPKSLENIRRIMGLPQWASEHHSEYACALCEFLHRTADVQDEGFFKI